MDVNGHALSSFSEVRSPRYLSLDSEGHVLVADFMCFNTILLLSRELKLQRVFIDMDSEVRLWQPERLCFSELTSQLFVAHCSTDISIPDIISVFSLHCDRISTPQSAAQFEQLDTDDLFSVASF